MIHEGDGISDSKDLVILHAFNLFSLFSEIGSHIHERLMMNIVNCIYNFI